VAGERTWRARAMGLAACAALAAMVMATSGSFFDRLYERLEAKRHFTPSYVYRDLVETKSGVAAVTQGLQVLGSGGVYEGGINTGFAPDTNGLFRPLSVSYWHPAPHEVLLIGVSAGAWTQITAQHPQVEKLTAVEINPGYFRLIRKYPQVRSVLNNPKVSFVIDDGRRWLTRHPEARFDVILSDTNAEWRANGTNVLSREFLELIRRHLKPDGVFFYNLSGSPDAQLTAVTVFPYAMMIGNAMAVSDSPFQLDIERWKRVMAAYRLDGAPLVDLHNPAHQQRFNKVIRTYLASPQRDAILRDNRAKRIVTDDNMGREWLGLRYLLKL
jgi:spermidine synthase